MKKVLFVATVTRHINAFHIPYLKWFKEQGYEVHVASNGNEKIEYCDKHFNLPFERFPLKVNNIKTYKELKKIIDDNNYEIIHCHTPVGGVLARLAARKARKKGTRVIYTAHGFHFYKGAPLLNWIIYYPIEKICAKWTDCLITINEEDYKFAQKHLKPQRVEHIHGIGVDTQRISQEVSKEQKDKLRKKIGINKEDIVFSYIAELNKNKNQILLIETIEKLQSRLHNAKLLLVGDGILQQRYKEIIKEKKLEKNIFVLGRRNDINEILSITDIYLASSIREGLGLNIIEAMYKKVLVIAYNNRGHREIVLNNKTGILLEQNTSNEMVEKIINLLKNSEEEKERIKNLAKQNVKKYLLENVIKEMERIYMGFMKNEN